jgi:myo-inositol 2-dehydrogenase/D-chiro-inositol 1-dehydrogenase
MGGVHAGILQAEPRAQIAAVFDADPARAAALAARCGAAPAADLAALWRACDAVYICAPNVRHGELALEAIAAGKHVFCEKPMATDLGTAQRVAEAAASSGRLFQVGHNRRFAPVYAGAREEMQKAGPALCAEIKMNRGELEKPAWTADAGVTGGFLYETPIHVLDLANWFLGPLREVYARGGRRVYPQDDTFSALLIYERCQAALTTCAYTGWSFPFERFEIYGRGYTIRTEEMETLTVNHTTTEFRSLPRDERWGYVQEDRLFLESITAGLPAAVTAEDGLASVRAAEAVYQSLREGRVVKVA